jgi:hypothetical protein
MGRLPSLVPDKFYNYVSNATPDPPGGVKAGETWYEPDTANSYVYDGGTWVDLTVVDHSQLSGVGESDHHNPVTASNPLTVDAAQGLGMSLASPVVVDGNGDLAVSLAAPLHVDGNGDLDIPNDAVTSALIAAGAVGSEQLDGNYPDGSIGTADLGFDTATQTELNNHAGNSTAHHAKPPLSTGDGTPTTYTVIQSGSDTDLVNISGSGVLLGGWAVMDRSVDNTLDFVEVTADNNTTETFAGIYKSTGSNSAEMGLICSIPVVEFTDGLQVRLTTPGNDLWGVAHVRQ